MSGVQEYIRVDIIRVVRIIYLSVIFVFDYYYIFNLGILLSYCKYMYSVCPVNVIVTVIIKCIEILK